MNIPSAASLVLVSCLLCQGSAVQGQGQSTANLITSLKNGTSSEKLDAATQLAGYGALAASAVPALTATLNSDDIALTYECLIALGNIGPLATQAVAPVSKIAIATGPVRATALETLREIGTASEETLTAVKGLTTDSDDGVAVAAIRCVNSLSQTRVVDAKMTSRLASALSNQRASVRNAAVAALIEVGPTAIPELKLILSRRNARDQVSGCRAAAGIATHAAALVPQITTLLSHQDKLVVRMAARALGAIGAQPKRVVPALLALLQSDSAAVRADAVSAIESFGADGSTAISQIAQLLENDDSIIVRTAAADALGMIGNGNSKAANALLGAVQDPHGAVTIRAANALSQLGEVSVAPLTNLLKTEGYAVLAAGLLGEMGAAAAPAVEDIVGLLESDDTAVRREGFIALAGIGSAAKDAVPALLSILHSEDAEATRAGAAYALGKIGEQSCVSDLKKIVEASTDKASRLRRAAAFSLVTLQPGNAENAALAVPVLLMVLDSEDAFARGEAISAIGMLGPHAKSAVTKIAVLARDDTEPSVRAEAFHTLGLLEASGDEALASAIAGLEDDTSNIRNSATFLLGTMGTAAKASASKLRANARTGIELDTMVAAWALVRVDPSDEHGAIALPLMLKALTLPNPRTQTEAARTIGLIGVASDAVRNALTATAGSDDADVSDAAREALQKLK